VASIYLEFWEGCRGDPEGLFGVHREGTGKGLALQKKTLIFSLEVVCFAEF